MNRDTRLEIDLTAFSRNLATIRDRIAPAQLMLVVKDDAYAHGLVPIVETAFSAAIRYFGCLDLATARRVRAVLGHEAQLFAWYLGPDDDLAEAIRDGVELGIGSPEVLSAALAAARASGISARIHLKIDTGLNRNGFRSEQWDDALDSLEKGISEGIASFEGIWSHIAEASDEEDDRARERFDAAYTSALRRGLHPRIRHLAASAAGFARDEFSYDLVRMGAFTYGIAPAGGPTATELGLLPIASLHSAVDEIVAGSARVPVGGRHGLPRHAAGQATVSVAGVSRVITEIEAGWLSFDAEGVNIGAPVVIFGSDEDGAMTSTHWGEIVDTIGEEIQLRVHTDIPRVYRRESG